MLSFGLLPLYIVVADEADFRSVIALDPNQLSFFVEAQYSTSVASTSSEPQIFDLLMLLTNPQSSPETGKDQSKISQSFL